MTIDALAPLYPWVKSLHLVAVFAWMAGLFYLPRLYVYHHQVAAGSKTSELFKTMERRLLRAIMNPAMLASWLFGTLLVLTPGVVSWSAGWWHGKFAAVLVLTAFHMHLAAARKEFAADARPRSGVYWRAMNEVPTLALLVIVFLVILKPWS